MPRIPIDVYYVLLLLGQSVEVRTPYYIEEDCCDGMDYCYECARDELARRRASDNSDTAGDDDPRLVCHAGAETDVAPHCDACGCRLALHLTDYATEEELGYYEQYGFDAGDPGDAHDVAMIVQSATWSPEAEIFAPALRLGRSFLDAHRYEVATEPGRWADDGGRV